MNITTNALHYIILYYIELFQKLTLKFLKYSDKWFMQTSYTNIVATYAGTFAKAENRVRNIFSRKISCKISNSKMPIKCGFFGIIFLKLLNFCWKIRKFISSQIMIFKIYVFSFSFYYSALLENF